MAEDKKDSCPRCQSPVGTEDARCGACGAEIIAHAGTRAFAAGDLSAPVSPGGATAPPGTAEVPPLVREEALSATLDATMAPLVQPFPSVGERYQILAELGRGGMGAVYRARDLILEEEIALKVLLSQFTASPDDLERFKSEIKTSRKVTHPNVIRIHDFGVVGREAFISMEMLTGGDLKERIDGEGLAIPEVCRVMMGVCAGLQAAHDQGVIHRDLKPQNILFDAAGTPKISDFGIARVADTTSHTIGYLGTPFYMSPEQAQGFKGDYRADIYALGIVLYQMLTGRLPFYAETLVGIAMKHAKEPPPPPRSIRPDLPEGLERILLKMLEKEPENRFQRASEVAQAIATLGQLEGPAPTPGGEPDILSVTSSTHTSGEAISAPRSAPPRRWGYAMAMLILVGGGVAALMALRPWENTPEPERPPARRASTALEAPGAHRGEVVSAPPAPTLVPAPVPAAAPPSSEGGSVAKVPELPAPKKEKTRAKRRAARSRKRVAKAPVAAPETGSDAPLVAPPVAVVPEPAPQEPTKAAEPPPPPAPDPKVLAAEKIREGDQAFADFRFRDAAKSYAEAKKHAPEDSAIDDKVAKAKLYGRYSGMVYVPSGEFVYGSNSGDPDERPRRRKRTGAFYVDKYEVTNRQYAHYVRKKGAGVPSTWSGSSYPSGKGSLPVSGVSWQDARSYCRWRGKRLPSEVEWEKAARGTDGRKWPWGESASASKAVVRRGGKASAYGYKSGRSPFGAHHMAGNVWEWTASRDPASKFGKPTYIIRGGAYNAPLSWARTSNKARPTSLNLRAIGFRCVR